MKYIFKTQFKETKIGNYYNEDLMKHINDGWEMFHIEKGMIVYRKQVDEQEYKNYFDAVSESVDRMNNCPYLD